MTVITAFNSFHDLQSWLQLPIHLARWSYRAEWASWKGRAISAGGQESYGVGITVCVELNSDIYRGQDLHH